MMDEVKMIDIKSEILSDNKDLAEKIRTNLRKEKTLMVNVMGSPGSGKTSCILAAGSLLTTEYTIAVLEADVDSSVDAQKVTERGIPAVQIKTGGFCHLDAAMLERGLQEFDLPRLDILFVENIGNLICPAECDIGAHHNTVILSIPEGDDKPLKYPLMFRTADSLVINKTDYLPLSDFDIDLFRKRIEKINPGIPIHPVSCKTAEGVEEWTATISSLFQKLC
jgi:hydrogenase nickel incorporation protein HypB